MGAMDSDGVGGTVGVGDDADGVHADINAVRAMIVAPTTMGRVRAMSRIYWSRILRRGHTR